MRSRRLSGGCDAHHARRYLVRREQREVDACLVANWPDDIFRHLAAAISAFPVQQAAWHAAPATGVLPSGRHGSLGSAVGTIEDLGAGRIGVDVRRVGRSPSAFCQDRIVRNVWLRLLRQPIAASNLSAPASLMTSGSAVCRAHRTFALRAVCQAKPAGVTANARTAAIIHVTARRRGLRLRPTIPTTAAHRMQPPYAHFPGRDCTPLSVPHKRPVHDVF